MKKEEKGITIIALIVIIVVMLILAGITMGLAIDKKGIINEAKTTTQNAQRESIIEKIEADLYNEKIKTGNIPSKNNLKQLIEEKNYGTINDENSFTTKVGNYKIEFNEIQGWENEYKELVYLESTGTQYIDTEFKPNYNTTIEIYGNQIGSAGSLAGANPYFVITSGSGKYRFRYNNTAIDSTLDVKTLAKLKLDKNKIYINDTLLDTFNESEFQTTYNTLLFGRNNSSGSPEEVKACRIYYCKIWDNGKLIRDFIPVLDENDVSCLYDKIDGKYYYNKGTGEFSYKMKIEPKKVEYIESTGTQYIDTEFKPNHNTTIEIYGNQIGRAGSLAGANPYFVITSGSGKYRFRYNNNAIDATLSSVTLAKLKLDRNKAYINDTLLGTFNEAEFQTAYNALLFGRNSGEGKPEEVNAARIYYCKIWDKGNLIRDFVPMLNEESTACLYDKVEGKYYYNKGTGEFSYGE